MDEEPQPNRRAMLALLLIVVLLLGGWWLVHVLRHSSAVEDCLLRGGHDCAPVSVPSGQAGRS